MIGITGFGLGWTARVERLALVRAVAGTVVAVASLVGLTAVAWSRPAGVAPADMPSGDYHVVNWTTTDGLPQSTITDIALLPNGELWLATFGGLARFDGLRFHVLDIATDEGLPANRIVSLAPAGADAFFFLTQQGHLGRVDRGRATTLAPPSGASADSLSLFVDGTGRAYSKLADGSVWVAERGGRWRQVLAAAGHGGAFHAFAAAGEDAVWASWGNRLVLLVAGQPRRHVDTPFFEPDLFPRAGGGLWLGLADGFAAFVEDAIARASVQPAQEGPVNDLDSAVDGALWVTGRGQVARLTPGPNGDWRREPVALGSQRGVQIRSLRTDPRGGLWVGTNGSGLYRVLRPSVRRLKVPPDGAAVTAMAPDGRGGALVGSGCRELVHLEATGAVTRVRTPDHDVSWATDSLSGDWCGSGFAVAPDGRIWIRGGPGLYVVSGSGLSMHKVAVDLPAEEGPVVSAGASGVWVASRSGTVQLVSPQGVVSRQFAVPAPVVSAASAPDGTLWLGGDGEVFRVGPSEVTRFGAPEHVPRGLVRDILPRADGEVWVGTYGGGLGRLRDGRTARVGTDHGLPDNAISRLIDDGKGRLWVSTNRGLAVVDWTELREVADGTRRAIAPVVLGPERGVPEANFGSPAGFAGPGGRLWFGTIDGVVQVDASAFPFNAQPPVVRIEGLWADDRPLPLGGHVVVPALTARVHLTFSSDDLFYPGRTRFRFRVDGHHSDWVDLGTQRSVDWSPATPGPRRLLVDVRNEDGVWSRSPAFVVLDVQPAWWQTMWFRVGGVVVVLFALGLAYRWRVRVIERHHADRLEALETQRRAEERVAALRTQLEHVARVALAGELAASLAHEVSQPLGAIVNNAEAGKRNLRRYLMEPAELEAIFGDIVADGMRASDVIRGLRGFLRPLEPEAGQVDLSALVREMLPLVRRELEEHRVSVDLQLSDALPPVEGYRVQLGQVVVNLVMNACEALADAPGSRRLVLATRASGAHVHVVVRDNGPGLADTVAAHVFDPFVTTKPGGLGMGLAICRAIAENHGGHIHAAPGPAGGVEMTVSLPAAAPPGRPA